LRHLIVRIFYVCGLRPGELFALRVDDVEPKLLRIDEALKETEKGADRVGETKTTSSNAYVSISDDLYQEVTLWLSIRNMADPYHRNRPLAPNGLLFPSETGNAVPDRQLPETSPKAYCGHSWDSGHDLPGSTPNVCNRVSAPWIAQRCAGSTAALKTGDDRLTFMRATGC